MDAEFLDLLDRVGAATAAISGEYFQLPVAERDAVYRERVYCYELYHQLRSGWPFAEFSLGGEVDKAGHPLFRNGPYAKAKPDLLVHRPGDMSSNLAVIEVKPTGRPPREYFADIQKLSWFCDHAEYHYGVLLIYGGGQASTWAEDTSRINWPKLKLLRHATPEARAQLQPWQSVLSAI